MVKSYQTEWLKRKTEVQRGEKRSSKEKNLGREITIECFERLLEYNVSLSTL